MGARVFRNANTIVYGRGALEHLREIESRRALVVTGQSAMDKTGVLAKCVSLLEDAGASVEVVRGTRSEPPIEDVESQLGVANAFEPDLIVALGGGSVIDSAKALWAFYEHPELDRQGLFMAFVSRPCPLPRLGRQARLVAIPSTSGTGSETSGVAVLVEAESRVKRVLLSSELVPSTAIIDSDIACHMPPSLAAWTGMDALTHALESAVSPWSTDFSEGLALRALKMIFQNLQASCEQSNPDAREKMHYAATLAGMAINNSITGLAHGMDKIGLLFDLSHGLTCGVLLPYTIRFSAPAASSRYAEVARAIGLEGEDDEGLLEALLSRLAELSRATGIPRCFGEMGIDEARYLEGVDRVSEYALKAGPTVFNPRVPSADELRQLYLSAYRGTR